MKVNGPEESLKENNLKLKEIADKFTKLLENHVYGERKHLSITGDVHVMRGEHNMPFQVKVWLMEEGLGRVDMKSLALLASRMDF